MPKKLLVCLPMLTVIVEHGTIAIPIVQFEIKVIYYMAARRNEVSLRVLVSTHCKQSLFLWYRCFVPRKGASFSV